MKYLQNYSKDTAIPMVAVLMFESTEKKTRVTYRTGDTHSIKLVHWPLKVIMQQHAGQFMRLSRNRLVRGGNILRIDLFEYGWKARVSDGINKGTTLHPVSRRCKPQVNQYLKARDAA